MPWVDLLLWHSSPSLVVCVLFVVFLNCVSFVSYIGVVCVVCVVYVCCMCVVCVLYVCCMCTHCACHPHHINPQHIHPPTPLPFPKNIAARGFKDGRTPLIGALTQYSFNLALDWLLLFSLNWGVPGAAVAAVTAQYVGVAVMLWCQYARGDWTVRDLKTTVTWGDAAPYAKVATRGGFWLLLLLVVLLMYVVGGWCMCGGCTCVCSGGTEQPVCLHKPHHTYMYINRTIHV